MKRITIGILAHVDAGKTTLSEAFLYMTNSIRNLGRVDKKNTLLDNYEAERRRGITIFSKQAHFEVGDTLVTFLDTPGHVDFATEAERTLQVLDYCVLVVSGADGVMGHTKTLWKLLVEYNIPTFIFVNKMDQSGCDREKLIAELKSKLSENIIPCDNNTFEDEELLESMALCDEKVMNTYLETGIIEDSSIREMIAKRQMFLCYFGSALKLDGVDTLLAGLDKYTHGYSALNVRKESDSIVALDSNEFGAKVYKITRDDQGNRLTHLKVTNGKISARQMLTGIAKESEEEWNEKVNQIRIYQGEKFESVNECEAGEICSVSGLSFTYPGQGLGIEKDSVSPFLVPIMTFRVIFDDGIDAKLMYSKIKVLSEEDPSLNIEWNDDNKSVEVRLMGEVQTQIIKETIKNRFGVDVNFGEGKICYKETIKTTVEGVGHFEPLRHYAEVHLLMEPGEVGSGLVFEANVSEDILARNWQRLILTHLAERRHRGVLTGSPITDMKITIVNGKAHLKHTEGGDFRQATYRAVRQGLMKAESVLLEPFYEFRMEMPQGFLGRALSDLDKMNASFKAPEIENDSAVICGIAPVSVLNGYQKELVAYTKGQGRLSFDYAGYYPCHNTEEVIERIGYNPDADTRNPSGSVFCAHGAGFVVDWMDVEEYMHLEKYTGINVNNGSSTLVGNNSFERSTDERNTLVKSKTLDIDSRYGNISYSDDKELQDIFRRTYGDSKKKRTIDSVVYGNENDYEYESVKSPALYEDKYQKKREIRQEQNKARKEYLLVDGYNVIHANPELEQLMEINLEASRNVLMDVLCNYQGFRNMQVILVFDAYKVKGNPGEILNYNNISVVYTKEAETADRYIERTAHEISHDYNTTVVTSDGLEQIIIRGAGCRLMSSREFWDDVSVCEKQIDDTLKEKRISRYEGRNYLFNYLSEDMLNELEKIRLGEQ